MVPVIRVDSCRLGVVTTTVVVPEMLSLRKRDLRKKGVPVAGCCGGGNSRLPVGDVL